MPCFFPCRMDELFLEIQLVHLVCHGLSGCVLPDPLVLVFVVCLFEELRFRFKTKTRERKGSGISEGCLLISVFQFSPEVA